MTVITIEEMEKRLSTYLYRASLGESFIVEDSGLTVGKINTNALEQQEVPSISNIVWSRTDKPKKFNRVELFSY